MFSSCAKGFVRVIGLVALCMVFAVAAMAQSTTEGAIGGVVSDNSGAVIPGAKIEIRNTETNASASATSDAAGRFRVGSLQPGSYEVTVAAGGFSNFKATGLVVEVGRISNVDARLKVSGAAEVVDVTGEAPAVNTEQPDVSTNINQVSINELPINGRRWSNFALLTPGATPDGDFGLISFRGISGLLNNNTVDGGDNNQAFFSEERGRTRISYVVSQASVKEFQVNTSNYSAEYGRSAGGVVNAVTKSGTNSLHGSAFWYYRNNDVGGAFNPFTRRSVLNSSGTVVTIPIKPRDVRHQWGGTIGGPIVKDRLFFFFSYDQQSRDFPGVAAPSSPTFFNPLTASELSTLSARGVTATQAQAAMTYLLGLSGVVKRKGDQTIFLPKIDWKLGENHNLSLTYNRMRWNSPAGVQTGAVVSRGIASFGNDGVKVDSFNARLSSTLTPTIANELRFQYGRDFEFQNSQTPAPGEPTTGPGGFPPSVAIGAGGFTFGKPNFLDRAAFPDERRIQVADSMTISAGRHTLKFGLDLNFVNDVLDNLFSGGGVYSYSNRVAWISDFANPATNKRYSSFTQAFGPSRFEFDTTDMGFFIQDDYRMNSKLTVNLGMRYEYERLPEPQLPNPALPQSAQFPSDTNNFGPRIGVAFSPRNDGKLAIRGGYGIYYGRVINSTISNAITNTGRLDGQRSFLVFASTAGSPTYPNVLTTPPAGGTFRPNVVVFSPRFELPLIHQGDVVVEYELMKNTVVSASYLTSHGRNLPTFIDMNLPAPIGTANYTISGGPDNGKTFSTPYFKGPRPNTSFGVITNIASSVNSRYNALVLQFNRRMTSGLQFQNSYTYSTAVDDNQTSQTFTTSNAVLNPVNLGLERGRSNFNIRHRFVSSLVWQPNYFTQNDSAVARALFNGYTISPVIQISSGRPVTAFVSGNLPTAAGATAGGQLGASGSSRPFFLPRNTFGFPNLYLVDLRLSRRIHLRENMNLEFLVEAFNLLNHRNLTSVEDQLYSISSAGATVSGNTVNGLVLTHNPDFLEAQGASNTLYRERQMQWAIRFHF